MTEGVFIEIKNVEYIKSAIARIDNLTLLTGTDNNAIFKFVKVMNKLYNKDLYKNFYPKPDAYINIAPKPNNNKCYLFDFVKMAYMLNYDAALGGKIDLKSYLKKIIQTEYNKYDAVILYIPEACCLPAYDSLRLVYNAIRYLHRKNVDTIVVTYEPYIMELVADYGDYLFHKYDINCNCCIAEDGVIECGSHKDEGDRNVMLEKAFEMYNKSFSLLEKVEGKRDEALESFTRAFTQLSNIIKED